MRKLICLNFKKELSDPWGQVMGTHEFLFFTYGIKCQKLLIGEEYTHIYTYTQFLMNSLLSLFLLFQITSELNIVRSEISLTISFGCYNKSHI